MTPYAAIDVETSGLDPATCQVLELACVVETDWLTPVERLPTFRALVNPGRVTGEPRALAMNARLLDELAGKGLTTPDLDGVLIDLGHFLEKHLPGGDRANIAGKNARSFDLAFLRRSRQWGRLRCRHRVIDAGNLWWRPQADSCLPDLAECRRRAGLPPRELHTAVEDCRSVAECVRAAFAREGVR